MEAPPVKHGGSELKVGMRKEEVEFVIRAVGELIVPVVENTIRNVVKEEIQIALQKLGPVKDRNNELATATSVKRSFQLQFLDEVSIPVLTGDELNGKGTSGDELSEKGSGVIRLAVVDKMTGQLVVSGPEASAKVEIFILQANSNEDEVNWSFEDFDRRIIRGKNRGKPYFSKDIIYVYLERGMGILCDVKLGHGSTWVKDCWCRLGARVVDNFRGSTVKEAWTKSFMVRDCRIEHGKKKEIPSLSDKAWRLRNIWKGRKIDQRLQREKIYTVEDLLIRLLKDYDGLKNIVHLGEKMWEDMVKHARACPSGRRMYCYTASQRNTSVVFNIHGEILGLYPKRQSAAAQMSSQRNKDIAGDLFSSAIGHWEDVFEFDDESSLQQHLSSLVDQSGSMEAGCSVGPHNIVASEMIGVPCSDASMPGIISDLASTQEKDKECIELPFSTDDVPIMLGLDFGPFSHPSLDPETMFSSVTCENFMNADAGTEGTNTYSPDFMQPMYSNESSSFPFPATDMLFPDVDLLPWNDYMQSSDIVGAKWGWDVLISVLALCFSLKRLAARRSRSYCY